MLILFLFSFLIEAWASPGCVDRWANIDRLQGSISGLSLSTVKKTEKVTLDLEGSSTPFSLEKRKDRIYVISSEGSAYVSLCPAGRDIEAVASLGILGTKKAKIRSLGGGVFNIISGDSTVRAKVRR